MLFIIFTYEREQMLKSMLGELFANHVIVIDDGSKHLKGSGITDLSDRGEPCHTIIHTIHEGKKGFWKKWLIAQQIALGSEHDWFCFLNDDLTNIDLKAIEAISKQPWQEMCFAMNLLNCGERYRWGKYQDTQPPFELAGRTWSQCDYVDGNFITNRTTLETFDIDPVPLSWFDRPDKSSGVGYQMTMKLRKVGCTMMLPDKSLAYHGDHDSVMHFEHRKKIKLISK